MELNDPGFKIVSLKIKTYLTVRWMDIFISYVIVDEMHQEHPELIKDQYWDQIFPAELPYTEATKQYFVEPFLGSTFGVDVPQHMQNFILLSEQREDSRKETTPVSIKGSPKESDDTFPFTAVLDVDTLGSSMSLMKPIWKRHKRNRMPRRYSSISTVAKRYISEEYQDEVFKMSDLSLASSRNQGMKFSSNKYEMNIKSSKQSIIQISNQPKLQNSKGICAFPFQSKRARRERKFVNYKKPKQSFTGDVSIDFGTESEQLTESSQCLLPFRKRINQEISYPILKKLGNTHNVHDLNDEQISDGYSKHDNEIAFDDQTETNKQLIEQSCSSRVPVLSSASANSLKFTNSQHLFHVGEEIINITTKTTEIETMAHHGNSQSNVIIFEKQGTFKEAKTDLKNKSLHEIFSQNDTDHNSKFQSDINDGKNECIIEQLIPELNNKIADVVIDISDEKTNQTNGHVEEKPDIEQL